MRQRAVSTWQLDEEMRVLARDSSSLLRGEQPPQSPHHNSELTMTRTILISLLALLFVSTLAFGQKYELAATGGGQFPVNSGIDTSAGWAVEGTFADRLHSVPTLLGIYLEVPVAVGLNSGGTFPTFSGLDHARYRSVFVTPGLKLKFAPAFPISPYLAAGIGVAHFRVDATATSAATSHTTAVGDLAGGIDWKLAPFVSARVEVRDYISGNPLRDLTGGLGTVSSRQQNIMPTAGLVLRF
jgi:hypothetical protein